MKPMKKYFPLIALGWLLWPGGTAFAAADEQCNIVRFSDLGEPELVIKTAAAAAVLEALGYRPQTQALSQNETYAGLGRNKIDIFFGADPRKSAKRMTALRNTGVIEFARVNQIFALPVAPTATTGTGELVAVAPRLGPPKSVASIPSTGEAQIKDAGDKPQSAGEATLTSGIQTLMRASYAQACPNVAGLIRNITFPPHLTVFVTTRMANEYDELFDAVTIWFGENRDVLDLWLDGVKTIDDTDAKTAVLEGFGF